MHKIAIPDYAVARAMAQRGRLHLFDAIDGPRTALVVIDLQNVFMLPGMPVEVPNARAIVPNVNRLAAALREAGGKVVWIQMTAEEDLRAWSVYYDPKTPALREALLANIARGSKGHDLYAELAVEAGDLTVEKRRYSAFIQGSSDLDAILRDLGIDTVVVVGTLTNVCCESTARDAMMLNYKTILVSDANATITDEQHNATLANILSTFGDVFTTEETIGLLAASGRRRTAEAAE